MLLSLKTRLGLRTTGKKAHYTSTLFCTCFHFYLHAVDVAYAHTTLSNPSEIFCGTSEVPLHCPWHNMLS